MQGETLKFVEEKVRGKVKLFKVTLPCHF